MVDRPVREFDLKRVGEYDCICSSQLFTSVADSRVFVMDGPLEFYSNLSLSMFDAKAPDYHMDFARGKFFDISPSLIDEFLCGVEVNESDEAINPDIIDATLLGDEKATWPGKGFFPASAMTDIHKVLHKLVLWN